MPFLSLPVGLLTSTDLFPISHRLKTHQPDKWFTAPSYGSLIKPLHATGTSAHPLDLYVVLDGSRNNARDIPSSLYVRAIANMPQGIFTKFRLLIELIICILIS